MIDGRRSEERITLDGNTTSTTTPLTFHPTPEQWDLQDVASLKFAGILDTTNFAWADTLFAVTVDLLNDHDNGFFDDLMLDLPPISYEVLDGGCDGATALSAYWRVRPVHALIAARCTGASVPLAWMGALENVPQISMTSTSARLSDKSEFPNFSRMVSPDDERGQVGALVATLGLFGWERVTILNTDTPYAKDLTTAFRGIWKGAVAYAATIKMTSDGKDIDAESARKVLRSAPHRDPINNSKVVVLLTHDDHAYPILRLARDHFPAETFFVGPDWPGRTLPPGHDEWMPDDPGYIGVVPYRQRPADSTPYRVLLELGGSRLDSILTLGSTWGTRRLSGYPAEYTVDAIVAMARAFAQTPSEYWNDGAAITRSLREQDFDGLSGRVAFTAEGDRENPMFSILNLQGKAGSYQWVQVGTTRAVVGSAEFDYPGIAGVCFAGIGCGLDAPPGDAPPVPLDPYVVWVPIVLVAMCATFGVVFVRYRAKKIRASRRTKAILAAKEAELNDFKDSVVGMCTAEEQYVPKMECYASSSVIDLEAGKVAGSQPQGLPPPIPPPPPSPPPRIQWCWQETDGYMQNWSAGEIEGDRKDCWIKYDVAANTYIEAVYDRQVMQPSGTYKLNADYTIDFGSMTQIKNKTDFRRPVKRVVAQPPPQQPEQASNTSTAAAPPVAFDLSTISSFATSPPAEIEKEPQMVLMTNDIVQISKKRKDGWAYGSKLHAEDEPLGRRLVQMALAAATACDNTGSASSTTNTNASPIQNNSKTSRRRSSKMYTRSGSGIIASISRSRSLRDDDDNDDDDDDKDNIVIITDSHGWFPMTVTRVPNTDDLATLRKTLGEANDLSAPKTWDKIVDPSVVQKSAPLNPSSQEYREVSDSFLKTLPASTQIVRVERIQNIAMYQSYIVKRKTVIDRDKAVRGAAAASHAQGLARFERRWLWHGTNTATVDKIIQQGFNRSFCGKNATVYGKGVYFARDTSYSACDTYSPADAHGHKYMLACSVVVGEFCRGKTDARTPDLRDATKNILYDSTVDNVSRPSLYVTYHDAQCYPEYLITFKK